MAGQGEALRSSEPPLSIHPWYFFQILIIHFESLEIAPLTLAAPDVLGFSKRSHILFLTGEQLPFPKSSSSLEVKPTTRPVINVG
jgi:hypothetical protein